MSGTPLIEGWLDDSLDDADRAAFERQLADPAFARELVRDAHFRHVLRRLSAASSLGTENDARAPLRMRTRQRPALRLAAAACLIAAVGAALALAYRSGGDDRPSVAGRELVAGQVVTAGEAPLVLLWRDGTRADLSAGSELRVDAGPGKQLAILRGSLQATVQKQQAEAPMRISGADCEAVVLGTVLEFTQSAAASRLSVSRGAVRLMRARDGFDATIADGASCLLPFHGRPVINRPGIDTTVLDDDGVQVARSARCGASDRCRIASEPGVSGALALRVTGILGAPPVSDVGAEARSWILLTSAPEQGVWNLGTDDGIEFWYRGPGTGGRVWVELICQDQPEPPVRDTGTHFVCYESDSAPGWRLIRLPWSSFVLREGQPPGTPMRTAQIKMINIAQLGESHPDFAVDRIAAWRTRSNDEPASDR